MSLDKAIEKGREHRKPYHGAQAIACSCRNHGGKGKKRDHGQCPYCLGNRMYQTTKEILRTEQEMEYVSDPLHSD